MSPLDLNIDELVPHRRPLRLIDEILSVDEDSAVSAAVITSQWPLLDNDAASPIVLIEIVAQTAAALGGYKKKNDGAPIGGGMIVAVKSAVFFTDQIPLNSRVVTRSTTRLLIEDLKEIRGVAQIGATVVAEITLQSVSY